jgi:hypothetical protein
MHNHGERRRRANPMAPPDVKVLLVCVLGAHVAIPTLGITLAD